MYHNGNGFQVARETRPGRSLFQSATGGTPRVRRLIDRGKSSQKAVTAVARELVGFVWAIAQEDQLLAA